MEEYAKAMWEMLKEMFSPSNVGLVLIILTFATLVGFIIDRIEKSNEKKIKMAKLQRLLNEQRENPTKFTDNKTKEEILLESKTFLEDVEALDKIDPDFLLFIGPKSLTPKQMLEEVNNLTPIGLELINSWRKGMEIVKL